MAVEPVQLEMENSVQTIYCTVYSYRSNSSTIELILLW